MSTRAEQRQQLRDRMRRLRHELDEPNRAMAADALCARLHQNELYKSAQHIAVYYANDGEIGTDPLIQQAWTEDKAIYLPVLQPEKTLGFVAYTQHSTMTGNRYGILEPLYQAADLRPITRLDLVLVPLVAFDHALFRLGMGGGYYDRTFGHWRTPEKQLGRLVGIGYDFQRVDTIQPESWDVPACQIVTDRETYQLSGE